MIVVDNQAPPWAHDAFRKADQDIAAARLGPFLSFNVHDASGTLPDATKHPNKIILLSNGTFWLAKSDGTDWVYPDGTTI